MINFTPPIKASLLATLIYMIFFQLFIQTGHYAWLYPANVFFIVCSVMYILFLSKTQKQILSMPKLTSKGMQLSFISSALSLAGAAIIFFINVYLLPDANHLYPHFKNAKSIAALIFANAFLVNMVCGGLGAFLTAGVMNEKNYNGSSRPLPSVRN